MIDIKVVKKVEKALFHQKIFNHDKCHFKQIVTQVLHFKIMIILLCQK